MNVLRILLLLIAFPCFAQTPCGSGGTGRMSDGKVVTLTAEESRGWRVTADGAWEQCKLTPDRGCGVGGTGSMQGRGVIDMTPEESRGWKIDQHGAWVRCESCRPQAQDFRSWDRCTSKVNSDDPNHPARDREIQHGGVASWSQWFGPMRGTLIEACHDGRRSAVASSCAPALACDTYHEVNGYAHDGRVSPVPLGESVTLKRADGATMQARCVAGELVAIKPDTSAQTTTAPPAAGCGPQVFSSRHGLSLVYWRYQGPRVDAGSVVDVVRIGGGASKAVCNGSRLAIQ